jgi:hypothetical protein
MVEGKGRRITKGWTNKMDGKGIWEKELEIKL